MQQNKDTQKISEIGALVATGEKIADTLSSVIESFKLEKNFKLFDAVKCKGLAMSSLLSILIILPFAGVASIWALVKHRAGGVDFEGKKDAFYGAKNNHLVDWRKLLLLHAKRFRYLISKNVNLKSTGKTAIIFDDSILEKNGKKIEKVSRVHNHGNGAVYVFGYKLLVCGFWDGASFIPLDFSLHREKGTKHSNLLSDLKKAQKQLRKLKKEYVKALSLFKKKQARLEELEGEDGINSTKTGKKKLEQAYMQVKKRKEAYKQCAKSLNNAKTAFNRAKAALKKHYDKGELYGLKSDERKGQFKKNVPAASHGFKRRKEAERSKIDSMLAMLGRAVKNGFVPDYVLTDSWFYCQRLVGKLQRIKNGAIKLVTMVKINNQLFTPCGSGKQTGVKAILNSNKRNVKKCRKLKANYIKVPCLVNGARVNLFFIQMGRSQNWHLLATTDLNLSFIALMEVYQIRWSIEVFFRDCKQYLSLGGCKSNIFDAQVADTTISMMQYVMIVYCKRINYQQSFGGLFKQLSDELVESSIVSKLINFIWELLQIISECHGIDFIELQADMIKNEKVMEHMQKLIPPKIFDNAA